MKPQRREGRKGFAGILCGLCAFAVIFDRMEKNDDFYNPGLFDDFLDTLEHSSSGILMRDEAYIGWCIFEEFDIEMTTFLHDDSLDVLLRDDLITNEIKILAQELRHKGRALKDDNLWKPELVRTNDRWRELFLLSDKIQLLVKVHQEQKNG